MEWSASRSGRFTPRERAPGTYLIGGWVGPRTVLDAVVKRKNPSPRRQSNPRTPIVQPVAQRYTDWAITTPRFFLYPSKFTVLLCSWKGSLNKLRKSQLISRDLYGPGKMGRTGLSRLQSLQPLTVKSKHNTSKCTIFKKQNWFSSSIFSSWDNSIWRLRCGLDDRGSIPGVVNYGSFSFRHHVKIESRAHPASYLMSSRGSYPETKWQEREADYSQPFSAKVRTAWSYTSTAWCLIPTIFVLFKWSRFKFYLIALLGQHQP
jgi:hypothetical protein